MLEAGRVIATLEAARETGSPRSRLLRTAVREIEEADDSFDWVGVYLLENGDALQLHAYVGKPTEHDRIPVGRGVCGTAVAEGRDINVPDVNAVDEYLACSAETASELVLLIRSPETGEIFGQLDLDSDRPAAFGDREERELRRVADWLAGLFERD